MKLDDFNIDLSLYRLFYLVCQNGSFTKTAESLGVTQPTISYSMKKLEDSIGVRLFERGNNLVLTPEGEALLPYVDEAMKALRRGEAKINDLINLKKGQIFIGVPSHIGVFLLTDIIKSFNEKYPNIKMRVVCKPTKELFRLLNSNELDIIIDCSPLDENIYGFTITKICQEKCAFACNADSKNLLNRKVSFSEILNYPLIVPLRTSGSTKALSNLFEQNNLKFDPFFEIATSDMIAEMVCKNLGIGYLFEKTIATYSNLRKIDVDVKLPVFDIFMIYKNSLLSITAQTFIEYIIKNFK